MPLFPRPAAPVPFLTRSEIRGLVACENTINRYGRRLVRIQTESVEDCAEDILEASFLFENDFIDEDEFLDEIDRIRERCDRKLEKVERASTRFIDNVTDACEGYEDFILGDDLLRFDMLSEETDGSLNTGSVRLLAGSLCGIKSLFAMQLVLFQVPRVMELFSYLGDGYIVITDENDFPIGRLVIPLNEECVLPEA
jgi:hypothetical protein